MTNYSNLSREELAERLEAAERRIGATASDPMQSPSHEDVKYRTLFDNMTGEVHVWRVVRGKDARIVTWRLVDLNPAAERSWGLVRADVVGKTADEIFSPAAVELFMPIVVQIFEDRNPVSWETYFPDLDQYLKMTSVSFGEHFISTGLDVSEIRRAQEAAERANEAKSAFLASMSHELRTPLNAILGYSQMLQMGVYGALAPKQQEIAGNIIKGGGSLLRLIDDVLDVARIESNQMDVRIETVDLNALVADRIALLQDACEKRRITIENRLSGGPTYRVKTDRDRLGQVLSNLLSNALRYNVDGGRIVVAADPPGAGYVTVRVSDTGIGIAPGVRSQVFALFGRGVRRPELAGGGVGVGLAVSKNIIERLGGWIDYRSRPGEGSDFWFAAPLEDNEDVLIWDDALRVGVDDIDKDHQELFALINRSSHTGLGPDRTGEILDEMVAFTRRHFRREEAIMDALDLPDRAPHEAEHRALEAEAEALVRAWRADPGSATRRRLQQFLRGWWGAHIQSRDMAVARAAEGRSAALHRELVARGLAASRPPAGAADGDPD
ncbi:MAG: hemerythrin domain-containing protein [Marivibrio sp.]|uniref:ATP-binding protein n=1 Tax=Marivibrio sp. TaxID=2039719 RepID=UPI0032EB58C0